MTKIKYLNIKGIKITLVGKYRYSKNEDDDESTYESLSTWRDWSLGFWFKKYKIVGSKNFKDPKKWNSNLVNQYMFGINLLIFKGWFTICRGGKTLNF